MNARILLLVLLFPLLWLSGCKPGRPDGVLPDKKMEDVLYDYHLAMSLVAGRSASADTEIETYAAEEAVFRRHGITRSQFEQSLRYYTAHAEEFYEIYDRLALRYGAAPSLLPDAAADAAGAHDVWPDRDCWLLVSPGVNRRTFEIEADTAFRPGDELAWAFSTAWFYKDGVKSAVASFTLHYANDSTATTLQYIFSSARQTLTLRTDVRQKLRKITGFIYQVAPVGGPPRLLVVSDISLFCRHREPEPEVSEPAMLADTLSVSSDSLSAPSSRLLRPDSVLRRQALPPGSSQPARQERLPAPPERAVRLQSDGVRPLRRKTREQEIRDSLLGIDKRRGIVNRSRR